MYFLYIIIFFVLCALTKNASIDVKQITISLYAILCILFIYNNEIYINIYVPIILGILIINIFYSTYKLLSTQSISTKLSTSDMDKNLFSRV